MIQVKSITVKYPNGVTALEDVSLEVGNGSICCILGANGAGKSTLLHACLNFVDLMSGSILVDSVEVALSPSSARQHIAFMPDDCRLYGEMTVAQNIRFFASLSGLSIREQEVVRLLERVRPQSSSGNQRVSTLSKGMRQKLGLAILLIRKARTFLLDEPTAGLDVTSSRHLSDILLELRADGACILVCTHDLLRAQEIGDRIAILGNGHVVAEYGRDKFQNTDIESLYLQYSAAGANADQRSE